MRDSYGESAIQTVITHLAALTCTLAIFLLLGFAYYGWGRALSILLGVANKAPDSAVMPIWLGWAFTLFLFQVLHFFVSITAYVVIPVLIPGVAFSIRRIINPFKWLSKRPSAVILTTATAILFSAVTVWVASRAMLPPTNYDSGFYHFNSIRWINTYPIVPGLGNLHGRLAFNQSFFTYVAALNFYPFLGFGRSLANSFLFLLVTASVFLSLRSALSRWALPSTTHLYSYVPDLFVLPVIMYLALTSDGIASPTPDLASTLLQLAMFLLLVHGIAEWLEGHTEQNHRAVTLAVLAATAVTVKLSNLVFSLVILAISLAYAWRTSRPLRRGVARIILPVGIVISVWLGRGFVLSGAPLYPSTIGYVPVEWAVPKEKAIDEANWIYSWPRKPGIHWSKVLGRWDWLGGWYLEMIHQRRRIADIVYPLTVFMVFSTTALALTKHGKHRYLEWSILLPPLLGVIYWFVTAPEPRFVHAVFWLLSIGSSLILLTVLRGVVRRPLFWPAFFVVFVVANVSSISSVLYVSTYLKKEGIGAISLSGWHPVTEVPLVKQTTDSGLVIYTPHEGEQCWDSPLPSTPDFNAHLRLRTPDNIASGFSVAKQEGR